MFIFVKANEYGVSHIICANNEITIKRELIKNIIDAYENDELCFPTSDNEYDSDESIDIIDFFDYIHTDFPEYESENDDTLNTICDHYNDFVEWLNNIDGCHADHYSMSLFNDTGREHWLEFSYYNSNSYMSSFEK